MPSPANRMARHLRVLFVRDQDGESNRLGADREPSDIGGYRSASRYGVIGKYFAV